METATQNTPTAANYLGGNLWMLTFNCQTCGSQFQATVKEGANNPDNCKDCR